ncbi:hypothetical protein HUJ04_001974 [Dendroctonus ponderosae]|nr:hypothetical protein HUJ04_001974 [Dendroctonus ponderosae]KAH1017659.1 hypothetical protein HUJ05_008269 [Dendroctonus ponderosae]
MECFVLMLGFFNPNSIQALFRYSERFFYPNWLPRVPVAPSALRPLLAHLAGLIKQH